MNDKKKRIKIGNWVQIHNEKAWLDGKQSLLKIYDLVKITDTCVQRLWKLINRITNRPIFTKSAEGMKHDHRIWNSSSDKDRRCYTTPVIYLETAKHANEDILWTFEVKGTNIFVQECAPLEYGLMCDFVYELRWVKLYKNYIKKPNSRDFYF